MKSDLQALTYKLTDREKFCLTAYVLHQSTENKHLAFHCSRKKPTTTTGEALYASISRWFKSPEVQAFIELETKRRQIAVTIDDENNGNSQTVSRDELLKELTVLFRSTPDPKLKAELGMKIAEIEKYKQVDRPTDEDTIHYYLPLKCNKCVLYLNAKAALASKK